jgi:5'-3' exonuclease
MGVPALFRWLSQRYPQIVSPVIEEDPREINGEIVPVDYTKPNPNGEVSSRNSHPPSQIPEHVVKFF